jgi:tRNA-specific 2-thiouridylase
MKNWEDDDADEYCSTRQDFIDAAAAADVIDIPLEAVNFSAEYKDRVFAEFLREYQAGPHAEPRRALQRRDQVQGVPRPRDGPRRHADRDRALRAHPQRGELFELLRGVDQEKDQSYFLHRLTQAQLARAMFPVGELKKTEVRRIAAEARLPNHAKKDSTGICFIGERPFRDFLKRYLPREPGPIRTPEGKQLGEHIGPRVLHDRPAQGHRHRRHARRRFRRVVRRAEGPRRKIRSSSCRATIIRC